MTSAWLDDTAWAAVQASVPITCVDLVPFRPAPGGVAGCVDGRFLATGQVGEDAPQVGLADVAQIGQRLVNGAAKKMADDFFEKFAVAAAASA